MEPYQTRSKLRARSTRPDVIDRCSRLHRNTTKSGGGLGGVYALQRRTARSSATCRKSSTCSLALPAVLWPFVPGATCLDAASRMCKCNHRCKGTVSRLGRRSTRRMIGVIKIESERLPGKSSPNDCWGNRVRTIRGNRV